MNSVLKYKRGQVWAFKKNIDENPITEFFVIVSNDMSNEGNNYINVAPIYMDNRFRSRNVITFYDENNKINYIMCDKVQTLYIREVIKSARYLYSLSEKTMLEVSYALANQLGIDFKLPNYEAISSLIEELAKRKVETLKEKYAASVEETALQIGTKLEEIFDVNIPTEESEQKAKFNIHLEEVEDPLEPIGDPINPTRRHWSKETKRSFLTDATNLTRENLSTKYNINPNYIKTYIRRFKQQLKLEG